MGLTIEINKGDFKKRIREKGKSLTIIPEDFTMIDIETTGYDTQWNDIIEIGALKVRNGNIVDKYESLIKPPDSTISEFISDLTGITNEMLIDSPYIQEVLPSFLDFIGDDILVGYNVNFDINFLYDNLKEHLNINLNNDYVDLLRLVRKLYPNFKNHKLVTVADNFKVNYSKNHRSIADCEITLNCFNKVSQHVKDNKVNLKELFKRKYHKKSIDLTKIEATTNEINEDHILYDRYCTFTGKLEKVSRKQAVQLVANVGGKCLNGVTKKTNYLILGNFDYNSSIKDGQKSSKLKKAEKYILNGQDLKILSEDAFYDLFVEEY